MISNEDLLKIILGLGADKAGAVPVTDIDFDPAFRDFCARNVCGVYGHNWMCPPHVGEIEDLIAQARQYRTALVYQMVVPLGEGRDYASMMASGAGLNQLTMALRRKFTELGLTTCLFLGAGGCRICPRCAIQDNQPCRYPDLAMSSLEAYGVNVSTLAQKAGMAYRSDGNTAAFFGAVLLREQ